MRERPSQQMQMLLKHEVPIAEAFPNGHSTDRALHHAQAVLTCTHTQHRPVCAHM